MKLAILSIAAFAATNLAQVPTGVQAERALEISIGGIGPAADSEAVRAVQRVIGRAVSRGVIDTYITYGYGIEGGSSSCIQLNPFQDSSRLMQLERELLQIRPNPQTTSYTVTAVTACRQQFTSSVPISDQLTDTQWVLEELGGTSVIANSQKPTLRFVGSNRIEGEGGCNSYSANAQIDGNRLMVSTLISTKRACTEPQAQEQENLYFRALQNAQWVSIEGSDLLIYSENFNVPLRFSRVVATAQSVGEKA